MLNVEMMQKIFGEMNGDVQLCGSGNLVVVLFGNSNGNLKLLMNDGLISCNLMEIFGFNVGNYLIGQIFGDEEVWVNCVVVNIDVINGVVWLQIFVFDIENVLINVIGIVSFVFEQLDLIIDLESKGFWVIILCFLLYVWGIFKLLQVGVKVGLLIVCGVVVVVLVILVMLVVVLLVLIFLVEGDSNQCWIILLQMKKQRRVLMLGVLG